MKFTKQFLLNTLDDKRFVVLDRIVGVGRWSVNYRFVFLHDGRFFETFYGVGATENQDESPWEYAPDEIECQEVVPVEKMVTDYEPKP